MIARHTPYEKYYLALITQVPAIRSCRHLRPFPKINNILTRLISEPTVGI